MKFEFFDKTYDDKDDSKVRGYFMKVKNWLSTATREALEQLRRILEGSKYSRYLVEGSGSQMLLESAIGTDEAKIKAAFTGEDEKKNDTEAANQLRECFNGKETPDKAQGQGKPATGQQIRELREALQTEKTPDSGGLELTLEEAEFLNKHKLTDTYKQQQKDFGLI